MCRKNWLTDDSWLIEVEGNSDIFGNFAVSSDTKNSECTSKYASFYVQYKSLIIKSWKTWVLFICQIIAYLIILKYLAHRFGINWIFQHSTHFLANLVICCCYCFLFLKVRFASCSVFHGEQQDHACFFKTVFRHLWAGTFITFFEF